MAIAAVLVGVAVAAVLYIASFGKSHHAEAPVPASSALAAAPHTAASEAVFGVAPAEAQAAPGERTVAR
ncbi:hypothetical protein BRPE64_BCDS07230 [Caballeronia insecticola]|uniref:Uncharacterized protein n=1 Tax=Caballeronia insecticola TaxID=758793 RepID=R4WLM1_9BURK|nr:hypothetical protein BRPE64_BCDS07230 [Caballeronia insecticola]